MVKRMLAPHADTWLKDNMEFVVDKYAGGYVVIIDDKGVILSDKDGSPHEILKIAQKQFPHCIPLFFRVPLTEYFTCALNLA